MAGQPSDHRLVLSPSGRQRYEVDHETGCWVWCMAFFTGPRGGYPLMGRHTRAHKFFFEQYAGKKVPDGMVVHHLCGNTKCVNPEHLTEMSHADHNRLHKLGNKMNLSSDERQRRSEHGKEMIVHAASLAYSKTTRSETTKKAWAERTPEERAEIGRRISKAKRRRKGVVQ